MMFALTLNAPPSPYLTTVMADYRQKTPVWPSKARDPDYPGAHYAAGSALTTSRQNVVVWNAAPSEALFDETWANYQPKTALGRKLLELRRAYLASGGTLLSADELDEEIRERRGGISDV
jgi:hypothetical protein